MKKLKLINFLLVIISVFGCLFILQAVVAQTIDLGDPNHPDKTNNYVNVRTRLGIGTSSPYSLLEIASSTSAEGLRIISSASWTPFVIRNSANNADLFRVDQNGNITAVGGFFGSNTANHWGLNGTKLYASSTSWNVGIGTTDPSVKLDVLGTGVFGNMTTSRGSYSQGLSLQNNNGATTSLFLWQSGVASAHFGFPASSNSLRIVNSSSNGLINNDAYILLTSTGRVGMGTTAPRSKLSIAAPGSVSTAALSLNGEGTYGSGYLASLGNYGNLSQSSSGMNNISWGAYHDGNAWVRSYTGGVSGLVNLQIGNGALFSIQTDLGSNPSAPSFTDVLTVKETNVGIGKANPANKLDVSGTIRAAGGGNPTSGYGAEVTMEGASLGRFFAYNRDLPGFLDMQLGQNPGGIRIASTSNVGIGTTAPSTGSKLEVNGLIRMQNAVISSSSDVITKGYLEGALNPIITSNPWKLNGSKLYASSTSWNVGIGTTNPGSKLSVAGIGASSTPLTLVQLFNNIPYAVSNGVGGARLELGHGTLHGYIEAGSTGETDSSNGYLALGTRRPINNVTEAMRIASNGNVGIGTTTPEEHLSIEGAGSQSLSIYSTDTGVGGKAKTFIKLYGENSDGNKKEQVRFASNPGSTLSTNAGELTISLSDSSSILQPRLKIDERGNVGIGTTNPTRKLTVVGNSAEIFLMTGPNNNGLMLQDITSPSMASFLGYNGTSYNPIEFRATSGYGSQLYLATSSNVGIGTIAPSTGSKLEVNGLIRMQNAVISSSSDVITKGYLEGALNPIIASNPWKLNGSNLYASSTSWNVGIGTTNPTAKLDVSGGWVKAGGYHLSDAATDSLLVNGDFETGDVSGWTVTNGSASNFVAVTGGYAGNYTAQITGNVYITSQDYIPVDPTRDVIQLDAYVKKAVQGTTPGVLYFGYYAYDANKSVITSAPCGSFCYFATSGWTVTNDGNWHKVSATTSGEGTSYPNFPVGTRYIRVLGLVNHSGSSDTVTHIDHISLKRINPQPLFVGNNFSTTNRIDEYQFSKLYTTNTNNLVIEPPSGGNVGVGTTAPSTGSKLEVNGLIRMQNAVISSSSDVITKGYLEGALNPIIASNPWKLNGSNLYASSTSWNVGIGTTNPGGYKLNVNGPIFAKGITSVVSSGEGIYGYSDEEPGVHGDSEYGTGVYGYSPNGAGVTGEGDNVGIRGYSYTGSAIEAFSFSGFGIHSTAPKNYFSGNVGIGTINPGTNKLEINGNLKVSTSGWFRGSSNGAAANVLQLGRYSDSEGALFNVSTDDVSGDIFQISTGRYAPVFKFKGSGGAAEGIIMKYHYTDGSGIELYGSSNVKNVSLNAEGDSYFNAGNVGIGTTAPSYPLEVKGNILSYNGTAGSQALLGAVTRYPGLWFGTNTAAPSVTNYTFMGNNTDSIFNAPGGKIYFRTSNTNRMAMSNAGGLSLGSTYYTTDPGANNIIIEGNVGIGTTNPSAKLEVGTVNQNYWVISGYTKTYNQAKTACISAGGRLMTYAEMVAAYKNGANSCDCGWLEEGFSAYPMQNGAPEGCGGSVGGVRVCTSDLSTPQSVYCAKDVVKDNGSLTLNGHVTAKGLFINNGQSTKSAYLGFTRNGLDASEGGNMDTIRLGIGTSSPRAEIHVIGKVYIDPSSFGGIPEISLPVGDSDTGLNTLGDGKLDIWANHEEVINVRSGNDNRGWVGIGTNVGTANPATGSFYDHAYRLVVNGPVRATQFTYDSDIRLKDNIKTLDNALDKVLSLRGVSFDWKADGKSSVGLIAQEVEAVFPELVSGTDSKGVQYGNLVAPLIEAVKEQQRIIDNLEARINILEIKNKTK